MKKVLIASLLASAFPAVALANSCDDYYKKMEEDMKKDGVYSDQAMKIVKEQVAGVPAGRQAEFCKSSLQGMKDAEAHTAQAESDDDGGKKARDKKR